MTDKDRKVYATAKTCINVDTYQSFYQFADQNTTGRKKQQQMQWKTMQFWILQFGAKRGGEWKVKLWFFPIYFHNPK